MPEYDMSNEKRPQQLLPEGLRLVRITEMILGKSKKGNEQYIATIEDIKTRKSMPIYLLTEEKKRWMLKSLLDSCGAAINRVNGKYSFNESDVIGSKVIACVEHYKEPWIDRDGKETMQTKAKISEFLLPEEDEVKDENLSFTE